MDCRVLGDALNHASLTHGVFGMDGGHAPLPGLVNPLSDVLRPS